MQLCYLMIYAAECGSTAKQKLVFKIFGLNFAHVKKKKQTKKLTYFGSDSLPLATVPDFTFIAVPLFDNDLYKRK